jgi:hypothetical protein
MDSTQVAKQESNSIPESLSEINETIARLEAITFDIRRAVGRLRHDASDKQPEKPCPAPNALPTILPVLTGTQLIQKRLYGLLKDLEEIGSEASASLSL